MHACMHACSCDGCALALTLICAMFDGRGLAICTHTFRLQGQVNSMTPQLDVLVALHIAIQRHQRRVSNSSLHEIRSHPELYIQDSGKGAPLERPETLDVLGNALDDEVVSFDDKCVENQFVAPDLGRDIEQPMMFWLEVSGPVGCLGQLQVRERRSA